MKAGMIIGTVSVFFALQANAADTTPQTKTASPNFEQHKADILKRIDERIAHNQEEKGCIQAAKNQNDIKACREKFKAENKEMRQKSKR